LVPIRTIPSGTGTTTCSLPGVAAAASRNNKRPRRARAAPPPVALAAAAIARRRSPPAPPQNTTQKQKQKQQGNNAFVRHSVNHTILSAEPLNLSARHSFSASGIANDRAVGVAEAADGSIAVTTKRPRQTNKPVSHLSTGASKKAASRQLRGLGKMVGGYRPDLKRAALAKLSAIAKAQRVRAAAKAE
jgi:hypothetical protein